MPITERTLRKWRMETLQMDKSARVIEDMQSTETFKNSDVITLCERILRMSSELLDQHLLRKAR